MDHPERRGAAVSALAIKRLPSGVQVVLDLADHAVSLNIFHDRFERNELEFVERSINVADNVVDVGANVGYFALSMAKLVGSSGSVLAIEPSPGALQCLRSGVDVNGYADLIAVIAAAAGNCDGDARFVTHRDSTNGGSGFVLADAGRPAPDDHVVVPVPLVRLATIVRRPVAFLKLDAEGSELNVLSGAEAILSEDRPVVLAELDPFCLDRVSGIRPRDLIDFMARQGYSCHQLGAGIAGPRICDSASSATEPVVFLPAR